MRIARNSRLRSAGFAAVALIMLGFSSACAMAGFGGSLQFNITDQQTRQLTIEVIAAQADGRIIEIDSVGEVELGIGTARIERYVIHRATFGSGVAVGYFLCPKPCTDPLNAYLVAYSPDHIFNADGQLELRFRVESTDGVEELSRTVRAEMLPALFQDPRIEALVGG